MASVSEALALAKRGVPVFRLRAGSKDGFVDAEWDRGASTTDLFTVYNAFKKGDYNIGCHGGGRFVYIDVDDREAWTALLREIGPLPPTFTVETPSGGLHYYFDAQGERYSQADLIPKKVNVRSLGGYVVGPGSTFNGNAYRVIDDAPIAPLPPSLVQRLRTRGERHEHGPAIVSDLDTPAAIERARLRLEWAAPAVQGEGGDITTFKLACAILDYGLTVETALELMQPWDAQCCPPWGDALRTKIENAWNYRQAAIGRDNPAEGFTVIEHTPAESGRPKLFEPSAARWVGQTPDPAPFVIDRLVPEGYVTIVGAAGGRGKSSLILQMMACIASGAPFLGYHVSEGAAAGVFCEDSDDENHRRLKSICRSLQIDFDRVADRLSPTSFMSADATIWKNGSGATQFLAELEEAIIARPDLRLLAIDGAADTFDASENDRGEVSRFMSALNRLAAKRRLAIVLAMHESKSTADGDIFSFSGTTAWFNKCRSALKISPVKDDTAKRTILHLKCNVGPRVPNLACSFEAFCYTSLISDHARAEDCKEFVRSRMMVAIQGGKNLSDKPKAGRGYAARWLAEGQTETDFTIEECATAMDQWSGILFRVEEYGSRKSRRYVLGSADGSVPVDGGDGWMSVPATTGMRENTP